MPKMGRNRKQNDRNILPKQKLTVYISRSQESFWNWSRPQKEPSRAQKRPKRPERPKMGQNRKQNDRARLPKPKLTVHISRSEESFWTWSRPQKEPGRAQKRPKRPKWGEIKSKALGLDFQNQRWESKWVGPRKILNLILTPKKSIADPKTPKKGPE